MPFAAPILFRLASTHTLDRALTNLAQKETSIMPPDRLGGAERVLVAVQISSGKLGHFFRSNSPALRESQFS
jgi:hypothetical protein